MTGDPPPSSPSGPSGPVSPANPERPVSPKSPMSPVSPGRRAEPVRPEPGRPPAVLTHRLAYAYPDGRQVLFGLDLRIDPGERVALLGPNGAGKTTLALHLNGILPGPGDTASGSVAIDGLAVGPAHLAQVRRRVGLVFQDPDDQLFMPTVAQDVAFGPANLGVTEPELSRRVAHALTQVGLPDVADRPPQHLSFGQRRRVAVATVLSMRPSILVLDEPSSNLDPASRRELADVLRGLDTTLLMVTHDLPYALELCPRSVVLDEGRVVADGPTRDILADRELMRRHRLELPYGFDPSSVPAASPDAADRET